MTSAKPTRRSLILSLTFVGAALMLVAFVSAPTRPEQPLVPETTVLFELSARGGMVLGSYAYRLHSNDELELERVASRLSKEYRQSLSPEERTWFTATIDGGRFSDFDPAGPDAQKIHYAASVMHDASAWRLVLPGQGDGGEDLVFVCPPELDMGLSRQLRSIPQVAALWDLAKELDRRRREFEQGNLQSGISHRREPSSLATGSSRAIHLSGIRSSLMVPSSPRGPATRTTVRLIPNRPSLVHGIPRSSSS